MLDSSLEKRALLQAPIFLWISCSSLHIALVEATQERTANLSLILTASPAVEVLLAAVVAGVSFARLFATQIIDNFGPTLLLTSFPDRGQQMPRFFRSYTPRGEYMYHNSTHC